jgi:hypothetical protein
MLALIRFFTRVLLAGPVLALALAGCSPSFRTYYAAPVAAEASQSWALADVTVDVPAALTVSEAKTFLPRADIVWREGAVGNRKQQVAEIVAAAVRAGAEGLPGDRPVRIAITLQRFHALTFEAERRLTYSGVHDIEFYATVIDAKTGETLFGPDFIEASLPALAGTPMIEARLRGESQRSQITTHVTRVIQGWLGLGPDPRSTFTRLGG